MERIHLKALRRDVGRVALGTWSIGGSMWGGTPEEQAVDTIVGALERGVDVIDTAPAYGKGAAEERVGQALGRHGSREDVVVATKAGLRFDERSGPWRDGRPKQIEREAEDSLRRLGIDYIDIYQIHWPDPLVDPAATGEAMERLLDRGLIRAVGVSNFSVEQMERFRESSPLHTLQPPYNLFERGIEEDVLQYCLDNGIETLTYGTLCRGLLSGRMGADTTFEEDDVRASDPKFQPPRYRDYLEAVDRLDAFARDTYERRVIDLAIRWVLEKPGATVALLGARSPRHLDVLGRVDGWTLGEDGVREAERIVADAVEDPVGPDFMAPPTRE